MNVMEGKEASTVANMFKSVNNLFSKFNLLQQYVTGVALDNSNFNISEYSSIVSRTKQTYQEIVIAGCPCHMLPKAPGKAADAFPSVCGF